MTERSIESGLPPRTARMWVQAVRPFSFTASIVPVLLGTGMAAAQGMLNPGLLLLTLLGAVAIQGAADLFSDYFDYRGGSDPPESYGSRGVPVRGILQPSEVFLATARVHLVFGLLVVIGVLLPIG